MAEKGRVIRSTGIRYTVQTPAGESLECKLKGAFKIKGIKSTNPIAVGDVVLFERLSDGSGLIYQIEPRRNYIIRKATKLSKRQHIIAANIDQALLVASLTEPRTSTGFIDRFLITAEAYEIPAFILFNKTDLYDEALMEELTRKKAIYTAAGYEVLSVSAKSGLNLSALQAILKNNTTLLSGQSGVGKSALINAIDPSKNLRIGRVSEYHNKGTHTTTNAALYSLHFGGSIIDTPGIKEFGLIDFHRSELSHYFPEMRSLLGRCHFNNCTHEQEPGCAVRQAVEQGHIAPERYRSYLRILHDDETLLWENQFRS